MWNIWTIYPAIAWVFLTIAAGLGVHLRRPISESQIKREIERQSRSAHRLAADDRAVYVGGAHRLVTLCYLPPPADPGHES